MIDVDFYCPWQAINLFFTLAAQVIAMLHLVPWLNYPDKLSPKLAP
jgi:hypothetical protein